MNTIFNILWFFVKCCAIISAPFVLSGLFFYLKRFLSGDRRPVSEFGTYKKMSHGSKLKRLFIDFPKAFVNDLFTRDPDFFEPYGVHLIAGEQGCGKTVTVAYLLLKYKDMYPRCQIKTNFNYRYQDASIDHWRSLVNSNNGIYGEIDVIDEIQNWFSSLQSRDFPPEMLSEITQQRKQRKMIIGTSQVFGRVAKPIREQVLYLYEPITLFRCLTIVRRYRPVISCEDGQADKKKLKGLFFFVHNKRVRESYDTFAKVEKLVQDGFKPDLLPILQNRP